MPNLLSIKEIKEDILQSEYKSVSLRDKNGGVLIPFNSKTVKIDQRLQEIEKRLASKAMKPGIYQIHAKHWERDMIPNIYYVSSGDVDLAMQDIELASEPKRRVMSDPPERIIVKENGSVSWEKYQALLEENLELQTSNARLQMEIDQLNNELDELEEQQENKPAENGFLGMGPQTQDWIKNIIETVTPVVDKVLAQRDTQQELQKHSLYWEQVKAGYLPAPGKNAAPPVQNQPMNNQEEEEEEEGDLTDEEELLLDKFDYLKQIDPDLYNKTIQTMRNYQNNGEG